MRIEDALAQFSTIHAQVLRSETFRGYRAVAVGATGLLALVAAITQEFWIRPATPGAFAGFWFVVAAIGGSGVAVDLAVHVRREGVGAWRRAWLALRQLLPALVVGGALTLALVETTAADCLPAVWSLCFGLGVIASRPFLPAGIGFVAAWFLASGAILLLPALRTPVPSPLAMGLVFGCGQLMAAFVLRRSEESRRALA